MEQKSKVHTTPEFFDCVDIDNINKFDLRSDIENHSIYDCYLVPQGYVGNRPQDFDGEYHEDDTWAIDVVTSDGRTVESYLYVSETEYEEDCSTINCK